MATNLGIDGGCILEAQKIGGHQTKKSAVTEARKKYILRRKPLQVTALFGKVDYAPGYDYGALRHRK